MPDLTAARDDLAVCAGAGAPGGVRADAPRAWLVSELPHPSRATRRSLSRSRGPCDQRIQPAHHRTEPRARPAMLKAVGFSDADLRKPLIGVANTWIEIGPCNYHLRTLAADVKEGIRAAGATPMEFNTVSISDGITMGTEGMRASLVSREVDRRLDRAGRAGQRVRRAGGARRMRQDRFPAVSWRWRG